MDNTWLPDRAYFEHTALDYPHGRALYDRLRQQGCPVHIMPPGHRTPRLGRAANPATAYREAKRTLVAGVHRSRSFQSCRPSADYQLPLVTSCPGRCAYCYLQTTLGVRPFARVWVNSAEILARASEHATRATEQPIRPVSFEASATGDPVATEPLTGLLSEAITWAAGSPTALLRAATKYTAIESLLTLEHHARTRIRLSVNAPDLVQRWETGTAPLPDRLRAVRQLAAAGYPVGFLIAPVFASDGWQEQYGELLRHIGSEMQGVDAPRGADGHGLTVEVVTHRFTPRARDLIESRHAAAGLPLTEARRAWRMGQFGYGKYVYDAETMAAIRRALPEMIAAHLPHAELLYIV